ncbi:MAG: RNA polymerase sigma factor [Actinomycetota bacterium]
MVPAAPAREDEATRAPVRTMHPERDTITRDRDSFGELYQRYACKIFRFLRSQVRSDDAAEDLTAQVFFKALRSASTFDGTGSYEAWLFQIARNCLVDSHRDKERSIVLENVPEPVDPSPSPSALVIDQESKDHLWSTIATLTDTQREAIVLRYMNDLTIDEVAKVTGRTPGAVRILLLRARNRLRKAYGKETP